MKASYAWICELVPGLSVSPTELAERLTSLGLAVDGLTHYGAGAEQCLVAQVKSVRPHPNSNKLRLVTVDSGKAQDEVVCGAPNVPDPGGLVVLAPLGAALPAAGLTIAARKVAGVESRGMLCSESELGLSDDSDGIVILPEGLAKPGTKLSDALPGVQDWIYELDLTPNRADALGHIGIARDVAAAFGITWAPPQYEAKVAADAPAVESLVRVRIDDLERCPHFGVAVSQGVTIAPSPAWLRYRLAALGVRPISNLVDITNLLMLEFGHPMHAYDLERVRGSQIIVRRAKDAETLTTLDGVAHKLSSDDLLICDGDGPVGLAGVMGGADSEVRDATKNVLFECAYFEARSVRRSARRQGMHTEASHRFERGVDPANADAVLAHALQLTAELAQGRPARGQLHVGTRQPERAVLPLSAARVSQLIGDAIESSEIETTLKRLGCELAADPEADRWQVTIPTHRPDLLRSVDLISEVARIRGIDRVQPSMPAIVPTRDAGPREELSRQLRAAAIALGLSEALTFAFVSEQDLARLHAPAASVTLKNPINDRHTVMRTSLLPGLLEAAAHARRHGLAEARLFTIGSKYLPANKPQKGDETLPEERLSFAALIAGSRPSYLQKPDAYSVWDAKGFAEGMLLRLTRQQGVVNTYEASARPSYLHPRGAATLSAKGRLIGSFGPLHPDIVQAYDLDPNTFVIELDAATLAELGTDRPQFREIPRFPASRRDLALVVSDSVAAGDILKAIRGAAGPLAEHVELFDRFVGGSVPKEHASLAFRVVYRAEDRTLTDAEVDERHAQVVAETQQKFAATLRS
jgi:phenylalanyl-tRNA synthetase beta chain